MGGSYVHRVHRVDSDDLGFPLDTIAFFASSVMDCDVEILEFRVVRLGHVVREYCYCEWRETHF